MKEEFSVKCLFCNKQIKVFSHKYFDSYATKHRKFCSHSCQMKSYKGIKHNLSDETRLKMRMSKLGRKASPDTIKKMSESQKGHKRKGWKLNEHAKKNIRDAILRRSSESWDWMRSRRGPLHHNWKGGQKRYKHLNTTPEYKEWRKAVFERDNYTCTECGSKGVYLEAHHRKSWAKFPESRYEVPNGSTLCKGCHEKTPNYKGRGNKIYV